MYGLSKQEKLDFILKKSKELGITSYEFGQNTSLSDLGARNILTGNSKNPRTKNLNIMLQYLESLVVGTNLKDENVAKEDNTTYIPIITKDRVVPYYNVELSSSDISNIKEAKNLIEFYIDYKPLNECTAYIPYHGNSMYPMFKAGDTLAIKEITNLNIVLFGEPHLVITSPAANSYKTVKLVCQHPDDRFLILKALHPDYQGSIAIKKEDILSLYLIKGKIQLNSM